MAGAEPSRGFLAQLSHSDCRRRREESSANIWYGDTLVLGGLISEAVTKAKDDGVPRRADIPVNAGQIRSESTEKRHVLIFITPTLVDPAGNRLHDADEFEKP